MQTRTCCPSAHVLVTTALLRALIFRGGQRSRLRTSSSHTASPKYASVTGFVWRTTWSTSRSAAEQCGAAMGGRARPRCNPAGAVEKEATPQARAASIRRSLSRPRSSQVRAALAMAGEKGQSSQTSNLDRHLPLPYRIVWGIHICRRDSSNYVCLEGLYRVP